MFSGWVYPFEMPKSYAIGIYYTYQEDSEESTFVVFEHHCIPTLAEMGALIIQRPGFDYDVRYAPPQVGHLPGYSGPMIDVIFIAFIERKK